MVLMVLVLACPNTANLRHVKRFYPVGDECIKIENTNLKLQHKTFGDKLHTKKNTKFYAKP